MAEYFEIGMNVEVTESQSVLQSGEREAFLIYTKTWSVSDHR